MTVTLQVGDCIGAEFEFLRGESLVPRHQILAHVAAVKAGKRADMVDRERYSLQQCTVLEGERIEEKGMTKF